ncbi:tRNA (guanine-N(7)-)-methyltransferase non-catalytic subunit wdr4 isoform X2 [Cololabis saira]|uniref:tRNA (guanine-N(7)-)-methyltransferase non-catalytic subunit wdr4 isoform X2 n=1 Tax=Cololabis saira TaxID=129043 RepID=UPI002AD33922|nr:tRNA (guanine-N(7)-)-methyltransferase non-catalytic subunit wdr4 isoform X2 [Cololabis saira]
MSVVGFSGEWILSTRGSRLVAVHIKESNREPYVFECSSADKKPKPTKAENDSDGGSSEEAGSDNILALVVSPSGKLVALTDDNKRLLVFQRDPWRCISTRWVVRRCVSLAFSPTEEELLVADKSGDVYSFSLAEPEGAGLLKMGHLSMLLAVLVSPDNKYIITADRDEKIRVSHHQSPYNIQSFCLGHRQFVSALHIPSGHPSWLLSGSGDGTLKLWEYKSGNLLQSCDLRQLDQTLNSETDPNLDKDEVQNHNPGSVKQNATVCRIISSPDGHHVAALCERVSAVQFFTLDPDGELKLVPHSQLHLSQPPLDMAFNPDGQLWILMESRDVPVQVFTLRQSCWQRAADQPELSRVTDGLTPHWNALEAAMRTTNHFQHLFKLSYDNITPYLQKKQQRLEEQQMKRTKVQEDGGKRTNVQEEQQMKRTKVQEEDGGKRLRTEPLS